MGRRSAKNIMKNSEITECRRCGTCCKKGGPSLHMEDLDLVEKGIIPLKDLFTIREGEPANDNIKGSIQPAVTDIIKIKGQGNSLICRFFDYKNSICGIYDSRPVECRVLKCWDTSDIERIYSKNRLVRKDLVANIDGLCNLVEEHQKRCSYDTIKGFINTHNSDKKTDSIKNVLEIINYDKQIRQLIIERGGLDTEILDFLFGRPLTETIRMFGFDEEIKNYVRNSRYNIKLSRKKRNPDASEQDGDNSKAQGAG